jgi:hypothetical protein
MGRQALGVALITLLALSFAVKAQAQYTYPTPRHQQQVAAYGYGFQMHEDGGGVTTRAGNEMLVERADGTATYYRRSGDWEYRQHNNGVHGYYHYDDVRQVQRFDYRNPRTGARIIGENPYPTNPYNRAWSRRGYGW